ncbi:NADP-dependent oxidoreductase [uncultured Jatrophihabitans sp.]|uniref:NADP-dependent oxidoreductase n=1 Tax=uncultured Jatrophihabitans sp. TaxID=1610747 RepID=UPI0035CA2D16
MARAVRFDEYGSVDVLRVEDVADPSPEEGQVVVAVVATSINPGENSIREGLLDAVYPTSFPSGEGSDLAGRVIAVGPGVDRWQVGDEVLGWTDTRSAHATLTTVPAGQLVAKPPSVSWEQAGALFVAGVTAYAAVRAVGAGPDDTVAVSGAAGGVGSIAVQLLRAKGSRVLGIAGPSNHEWLTSLGVEPVTYGDGLEDRLRAVAPDGIDAFIDTFGSGYVELAVGLGIDPQRIDTIIDFGAAEQFGVKAEGSATASTVEVVAELTDQLASGAVTIPIAATYPLEQVREAFTELAKRHTRGKIVLLP